MQHDKLALLTDFYELTMMNGYLKEGMADRIAVFDVFFRTNQESSYCIAAGLEQAVEYLTQLHFAEDEVEYLRSLGVFDEAFLQRLKEFRFTGDLYALPEGTVVFPGEPLLIVKAPIFQAQLLESALLNIVNFQTLIATKANRIVSAAAPGGVLEFGLRRAQAPDASVYGARATVIGGCVSTSNVLACKMFGLPPKGTHAHSWIMSFPSELEAFRSYARLYPEGCLLLVDTYNTLKSGMPNAITVFRELREKGYEPLGIRLDSGDLAYLSKQARKMLDEAGFPNAKVFVSGDLDEYVISSLKAQGAQIDLYGVGTRMITSHSNPSLGGVYKIAAIQEGDVLVPKIKVSENPNKITNPGEKRLYRIYDKATGKAIADYLCLAGETIDESKPLTLVHPTERWKQMTVENYRAKELYVQVLKGGNLVYKLPPLEEIRQSVRNNLAEFWEEYKRIERPQLYKVDYSDQLYELKQKLLSR